MFGDATARVVHDGAEFESEPKSEPKSVSLPNRHRTGGFQFAERALLRSANLRIQG
jgi:hypothetical protein